MIRPRMCVTSAAFFGRIDLLLLFNKAERIYLYSQRTLRVRQLFIIGPNQELKPHRSTTTRRRRPSQCLPARLIERDIANNIWRMQHQQPNSAFGFQQFRNDRHRDFKLGCLIRPFHKRGRKDLGPAGSVRRSVPTLAQLPFAILAVKIKE